MNVTRQMNIKRLSSVVLKTPDEAKTGGASAEDGTFLDLMSYFTGCVASADGTFKGAAFFPPQLF